MDRLFEQSCHGLPTTDLYPRHVDYLYKKDRLYLTKQHRRCTVSGCSGRLHTDLADPPVVINDVQQNHIADEELTRSRKTKEELCTAAQQRPLVPPSKVCKHFNSFNL